MGFLQEPRDESLGMPYEIIRCRPGKPVTGILLSRRHVGAELHYWKGRSILHADTGCEACENGYTPRWYGYVAILRSGIGTINILEFTARCWPSVREYYEQIGDLRCAKFNASRLRDAANAPMGLTISEAKVPESSIPAEPDLVGMLERMWEHKPQRRETGASQVIDPTTIRGGGGLNRPAYRGTKPKTSNGDQ